MKDCEVIYKDPDLIWKVVLLRNTHSDAFIPTVKSAKNSEAGATPVTKSLSLARVQFIHVIAAPGRPIWFATNSKYLVTKRNGNTLKLLSNCLQYATFT